MLLNVAPMLKSSHEYTKVWRCDTPPWFQYCRSRQSSQEHNLVDTYTFGGQSFPTQCEVLFAALVHAGWCRGRSSSTSLPPRYLVNMFGLLSLLRIFSVHILCQLHHGLKYTVPWCASCLSVFTCECFVCAQRYVLAHHAHVHLFCVPWEKTPVPWFGPSSTFEMLWQIDVVQCSWCTWSLSPIWSRSSSALQARHRPQNNATEETKENTEKGYRGTSSEEHCCIASVGHMDKGWCVLEHHTSKNIWCKIVMSGLSSCVADPILHHNACIAHHFYHFIPLRVLCVFMFVVFV